MVTNVVDKLALNRLGPQDEPSPLGLVLADLMKLYGLGANLAGDPVDAALVPARHRPAEPGAIRESTRRPR